jgi:hypothetical protein
VKRPEFTMKKTEFIKKLQSGELKDGRYFLFSLRGTTNPKPVAVIDYYVAIIDYERKK